MHLLIDNCSLLNLVYSPGYSRALLEITNLVKSGDVKLITHDIIKKEWLKHKEPDRNRKLNRIGRLDSTKQASSSDLMIPNQMPSTTEHLNLQYKAVEELLEIAIVLSTPDIINFEFATRYREAKAPFLKKNKDNLADWEIIGSAGVYCQIHNIPRLHFISKNKAEFAISVDESLKIHPDIQERFSDVKIMYYEEAQDFVDNIQQNMLPDRFIGGKLLRNEKFSYKASVKQDEISSLYYLFKDIYEEVAFIPPFQLVKYHPFAKNDRTPAHFGIFQVYNARDELVQILSTIKIIDSKSFRVDKIEAFSKVRNVEEKVNYVLIKLTKNLIFSISARNGNSKVNVHFIPEATCNCIKCCYNKLDFITSMKGLAVSAQTLSDELARAYYFYKFGNFTSAVRLYHDIAARALKENKHFFYFLAMYNLRHLGSFANTQWFDGDLTVDETYNLRSIDPIEECVKLKSLGNYDLMLWIADGSFFSETIETMNQIVSKIEESYYSYLRGGFSTNSYVWNLIQEFAVLDSFINENGVIYDLYSNFDRLISLFIKGLFASHAMNHSDNSSLETFDDYLVAKLIIYGDKQSLFRYFNHFKLRKLRYNSTSDTDFLSLAKNHLCGAEEILQFHETTKDAGNYSFKRNLRKITENIITFATLLDIDSTSASLFSEYLLDYLSSTPVINHTVQQSVASFLNYRGKTLKKSIRDRLMKYVALNFDKFEIDVTTELVKSYPDQTLPKTYGNILVRNVFKNHDITRESFSLELVHYLALKMKDNSLLTEKTAATINKDFDFQIYYGALMANIVPIDCVKLRRCIRSIDAKNPSLTFRSTITGKGYERYNKLDDILNVIFKYNIPLIEFDFKRFQRRNKYYRWLIDMESFDYTEFNMEWLEHYRTKYYLDKFSKSNSLKQYLSMQGKNSSYERYKDVILAILLN